MMRLGCSTRLVYSVAEFGTEQKHANSHTNLQSRMICQDLEYVCTAKSRLCIVNRAPDLSSEPSIDTLATLDLDDDEPRLPRPWTRQGLNGII